MRSKNNKAFRASAALARPRAAISHALALPAAASVSRRLGPRFAAINTVAAAVAGILYCAGGTAYAADQPDTAAGGNSLQEIVVTASAQGVKKLDASYNIVS
ncbi:MAG TPA: hypothetical protein VMV25_05165, partial [Steroidobacteraceae bacterium]|nr:hypothetical protein [Steroidobacteraceae bacterium]